MAKKIPDISYKNTSIKKQFAEANLKIKRTAAAIKIVL